MNKKQHIKTTLLEFINESKRSSTDSMVLHKKLSDKFDKGVYIDRPYDQYYETINISIKDPLILNDIITFVNKHNWYVSHSNIVEGSKGSIEIKPKYSKGVVEVMPPKLYHATPTENVDLIMKKGLKAKSNDIRHKYPDRIYVCDRKETLYPLIKELKRWKNGVNYSIIEIDTAELSTTIYKDISCSYRGCYYFQGLKTIKPEYLTVIENNI